MRLRDGNTPATVSWDTYSYNPLTYYSEVLQAGYYTSLIKYMIIED